MPRKIEDFRFSTNFITRATGLTARQVQWAREDGFVPWAAKGHKAMYSMQALLMLYVYGKAGTKYRRAVGKLRNQSLATVGFIVLRRTGAAVLCGGVASLLQAIDRGDCCDCTVVEVPESIRTLPI